MTSIFGVSSVNFLIHWGAAVIHYFIVQRGDIIPEYSSSPFSIISHSSPLTFSVSRQIESDIFVRDIRMLYTLVITVGILWFIGSLLSGYLLLQRLGSFRSIHLPPCCSLYGGRFYQTPLSATIKPTIPVTCIIGQVCLFPSTMRRAKAFS